MKIYKDCYVAIFLFLFCALGIYGIFTTETPMAEEIVGPLALSCFSISGLALCSCLILFYSLFSNKKKNKEINTKTSLKTLLFALLFALYLFSMVFIGEYIKNNALLNVNYGAGFFITSILFASSSMYILGQRNKVKIIALSLIIVSFLLLIFGHFFYVLLP